MAPEKNLRAGVTVSGVVTFSLDGDFVTRGSEVRPGLGLGPWLYGSLLP